MISPSFTKSLILVFRLSIGLFATAECQEASTLTPVSPPDELPSPDGKYEVAILHQALPHTDPHYEFFTLTVSRGGHVLTRFPTCGYLLKAYWSADGKYAAINNRRGNSGDYLWVFSLRNGRALRVPDDARTDRILSEVEAKFPWRETGNWLHTYTTAKRWLDESRLHVRTLIQYQHLEGERISVDTVYRATEKGLRLISKTIEKVPWPPSSESVK